MIENKKETAIKVSLKSQPIQFGHFHRNLRTRLEWQITLGQKGLPV